MLNEHLSYLITDKNLYPQQNLNSHFYQISTQFYQTKLTFVDAFVNMQIKLVY